MDEMIDSLLEAKTYKNKDLIQKDENMVQADGKEEGGKEAGSG